MKGTIRRSVKATERYIIYGRLSKERRSLGVVKRARQHHVVILLLSSGYLTSGLSHQKRASRRSSHTPDAADSHVVIRDTVEAPIIIPFSEHLFLCIL